MGFTSACESNTREERNNIRNSGAIAISGECAHNQYGSFAVRPVFEGPYFDKYAQNGVHFWGVGETTARRHE